MLLHDGVAFGMVQEAAQEEARQNQGWIFPITRPFAAIPQREVLHSHLLRDVHAIETPSLADNIFGYTQERELPGKGLQRL